MIEHELKFALTDSMSAEFDERQSAGLSGGPQRLVNRYFDTSAGELMNAGVSLRIRRTPDGWLQTVKAAGNGPFERYEWEQPVASETPEPHALPPAGEPAGDRVRDAFTLLIPVFETDFERRLRRVQPEDGVRVEMACDRGEIRAGNRSERIAEVELERKDGSAAAFYHFARQWAALHAARLLLPSKNERGLRLAGWLAERPDPVKAVPAAPDGETPVALAARAILTGHLNHVLANLEPVRTGLAPEGPHQLRVGLRRLRAAIRFLGLKGDRTAGMAADAPVMAVTAATADAATATEAEAVTAQAASGGRTPDAATQRWIAVDAAARSLAEAAGRVRDVDVFEAGLLAELERSFPGDAALRVTHRSLQQGREQDRLRLRETLESPATTDFLLQALVAIETLDQIAWPVERFGDLASQRIAALARKVRRRARTARAEADWHEVRIRIKTLRYALESCGRIAVDDDPLDALAGPLARWQEALGLGQDLAVARSVAGRALAQGRTAPEMAVRAAALIDGYRAFATRIDDPQRLRKPIITAMDRLLRATRNADRDAADGYHRVAPLEETGEGSPGGGAKDETA